MENNRYHLPHAAPLMIAAEIVVIVIVALIATAAYLNPDPGLKFHGYEGEYLTSSAQYASQALRDYGYIPKWQPYLMRGEPLIENPFSLILNPISTLPTLVLGWSVGMRYTVALGAVLAGVGGWALGRVLGFNTVARVFLALLMIGMGTMIGQIRQGYVQLGGSQAYIPWVLAGTVGILRFKHRRYPIVLTAVMLTLMFWAGNIYYLLPTLVSMLGLVLTHLFERRADNAPRIRLDTAVVRRLIAAGVVTLGLSLVTFLPIFGQQAYIGGHPSEEGAGRLVELAPVIGYFFDGNKQPFEDRTSVGDYEFYYSFILPLWFAALIFVLIPPIRGLHRSSVGGQWKIWTVGIFIIVFFTLWGTGRNPIVGWLYENVPLIGQWRFVGRMLAIAIFWIAVIAAMRVDGLWRAVITDNALRRFIPRLPQRPLAFVLGAVTFIAGGQVAFNWQNVGLLQQTDIFYEDECLAWLSAEYPDAILSVDALHYSATTWFIYTEIRHATPKASYFARWLTPTLYEEGNLTRFPAPYRFAWDDPNHEAWSTSGYRRMTESPDPATDGTHCFFENTDPVGYGFTIPVATLTSYNERDNPLPLMLLDSLPDGQINRYPDQIGLIVEANPTEPLVVAVQEVAYPGWLVEVDDQPATLESVGGLIGVVLPPDGQAHKIYFAFRPTLFYIGAVVTLITAVVSILYLLRADRLIFRRRETTPTL